jgi:hypothetical protein
MKTAKSPGLRIPTPDTGSCTCAYILVAFIQDDRPPWGNYLLIFDIILILIQYSVLYSALLHSSVPYSVELYRSKNNINISYKPPTFELDPQAHFTNISITTPVVSALKNHYT